MSGEDLASLIAYLKVLERDDDPGVSASAVRIATVVPREGAAAGIGAAVRDAVQAAFDEINARGGIHGRTLELAVVPSGAGAPQPLEEARRLLAQEPPFALVSGLAPGAEGELASIANDARIPLIGPLGPVPSGARENGRFAFHLVAGMREQALALADWVARELRDPRDLVTVVHGSREGAEEAARSVLKRLRSRSRLRAERVAYRGEVDAAMVARLRARNTKAVVFLGEDRDFGALTAEAERLRWTPWILAPGALAARAATSAPRIFDGKVFLAYPALPAEEKARDGAAVVAARATPVERHPGARAFARAAAIVLAEALRRTGRHLTREGLVQSLENLQDFDAGLGPRLAYGPGRRIGALGAYVVAVDLERHAFRDVSGWIRVDSP
jgi:ABC-type branched-subunit amino acid transport system substrate-binding protein